MFQLNCNLKNHETGETTRVSMVMQGQDWHVIFDYMIEVHCNSHDLELFPVNVTFGEEEVVDSFDWDLMDMVEVEED